MREGLPKTSTADEQTLSADKLTVPHYFTIDISSVHHRCHKVL